MSDELARLRAESHDGITVTEFDGRNVPCILVDERRYDDMLSKVAGRPLAVETDLDVLRDGLGHVFVEVELKFSVGGITEKVLVDAGRHLDFFEALADTAMLSLASPKSNYGGTNSIMIQLPRRDAAQGALEMIRQGLAAGNQDGAVTGI